MEPARESAGSGMLTAQSPATVEPAPPRPSEALTPLCGCVSADRLFIPLRSAK